MKYIILNFKILSDFHANRCRKFLENYMKCKRLEQNIFDHSMPVDMKDIMQPIMIVYQYTLIIRT